MSFKQFLFIFSFFFGLHVLGSDSTQSALAVIAEGSSSSSDSSSSSSDDDDESTSFESEGAEGDEEDGWSEWSGDQQVDQIAIDAAEVAGDGKIISFNVAYNYFLRLYQGDQSVIDEIQSIVQSKDHQLRELQELYRRQQAREGVLAARLAKIEIAKQQEKGAAQVAFPAKRKLGATR